MPVFFQKAQAHAIGPANIGAAIHIIANPARQIEWHWTQLRPIIRKMAAGRIKDQTTDGAMGLTGIADRIQNLMMLIPQRDATRL
ncbi:hypothetical protein JCM17843_04030 [Kordiimonadales bacterium JCM 17843]|nr:hypothetical protein JCM17843_04030 [Kordiimonadales bacterium JCM 17843]